MNYDKGMFNFYVKLVCDEMNKRDIKFQNKYRDEVYKFCENIVWGTFYPEHNDRYLKQCYYNLQEKYDRGIISKEEFEKIENKVKEILGGKIC